MTHADANRTVQCVNACAGIADPAAALGAAREALSEVELAFNSGGTFSGDLLAKAIYLLTPTK